MSCYDRGRRVWFETAPCVTAEGQVHDIFTYDRLTFYVLRYQAGDEPAFVVRRPGQFSWDYPREIDIPDFSIEDYNAGRPWPKITVEYGQDKFSIEEE